MEEKTSAFSNEQDLQNKLNNLNKESQELKDSVINVVKFRNKLELLSNEINSYVSLIKELEALNALKSSFKKIQDKYSAEFEEYTSLKKDYEEKLKPKDQREYLDKAYGGIIGAQNKIISNTVKRKVDSL